MEIIIFFQVLWIVLTVILAKRNERNAVWAFIWSLLFGIFALIAYAIAGPSRYAKRRDFEEMSRAANPSQFNNLKKK